MSHTDMDKVDEFLEAVKEVCRMFGLALAPGPMGTTRFTVHRLDREEAGLKPLEYAIADLDFDAKPSPRDAQERDAKA